VLAGADLVSATGEPFVEEYRLFGREGDIVWVRDEAVALPGPDGRRAWQGVMVDITERRRAEQEVAYLAYHDKLTGLPNRSMFEEALGLALARARRHGLAVAVLYLDLDDFKRINDTLGHGAGDDVLRQVAGRLQEAVRESDVVARHGGDEFLVLLDDLAVSADNGGAEAADLARSVAERIREALHVPVVFAGSDLHVSGSIGIAVSRGSREDEAWLVRRADAAMYRTKRESPGGIAMASERDEPVPGELQAERLRRAVEGDGLVVHYLPVVDLSTARIVGVEALVRWQSEDGRLIPPGEFLTLAEDLGLMGAIDERVMAAAFGMCGAWVAEGLDLGQVSVNLSAAGLGGADLHAGVLRRIEATGVDPGRVMLELAESALLADGRARQSLAALHDAGVRLAVDDFGTGMSSLAGLRDFPIDVIKLDRPLLRGVPEDPKAIRLLEAVVQLVRSLGAEPLAEGVETEGQRAALLAMGCRLGQGFRFSPPVPADQVEPLMRSGPIGG
jgi:diguanylate cyclase (GGDEF)-like protein